MSPDSIVKKIEETWAEKSPSQMVGDLDDYARCLSRKWPDLSETDRQLLLAGGAALFDAKMRTW
ncbi:hypothetical protein OVY01_09610 [Robbsia sp. Bb-Pol-6]|uniref:Uncharacterized protein n=1 Tax=Robbsia betulipollinis TaxID=2981849 RepID=A0ABT3ZLQ6_9BURK|nr:hypothetical protein [Robbsia betulipollinis]MCY0387486.1 hypothetical protein [Robbsia betulipollinis]